MTVGSYMEAFVNLHVPFRNCFTILCCSNLSYSCLFKLRSPGLIDAFRLRYRSEKGGQGASVRQNTACEKNSLELALLLYIVPYLRPFTFLQDFPPPLCFRVFVALHLVTALRFIHDRERRTIHRLRGAIVRALRFHLGFLCSVCTGLCSSNAPGSFHTSLLRL